ncbi:MAG: DNA alkylation repair protein [Cytophagales bacterium]
MSNAYDLIEALQLLKNDEKALFLKRFFKTGVGEYAEGDIFWGIVMPELRRVANSFENLSLEEIPLLMNNEVHEVRMTASLILTFKMKKAKSEVDKRLIFDTYVQQVDGINNWDLVDVTAPHVIGVHLLNKDHDLLFHFAKSENLWKQRIAVVSTLHFIKNKKFETTLTLSALLMNHKHDLMHKAIGWMLREIGKKDKPTLESFLKVHYSKMPRTMLRYSIERFDEERRQAYLKGLV